MPHADYDTCLLCNTKFWCADSYKIEYSMDATDATAIPNFKKDVHKQGNTVINGNNKSQVYLRSCLVHPLSF